jgi:ribonuclease P protein component
MRQTPPVRVRAHHSPPLKRILKTRDFKRAYAAGVNVSEGFLKIYVARNAAGHTRLGIVVGKRVSKKAVLRNRIKRIIRAHASQCLPSGLRGPYDIVIVVRAGIRHDNALSSALRANLKTALNKWPF